MIGSGIGRVLTPVNDPHGEGPESEIIGKEGDERGSQIKISNKLIGGMWMDGVEEIEAKKTGLMLFSGIGLVP